MKIVHHIFLILTMFMPVISSAGPLEALNIQSCHYICGISEFMGIISEDRIHNTVLITTIYAGKTVQTFIQKTLSTAYQRLHILDTSRYCTPSAFQEVFQNMPSEHIIYIVFDSAFTEKNLPLPSPPIEAMHSLATLKQNGSVSMQNNDTVEKKTINPLYIFSLYVWNRQTTLSLSTQEKREKIELIINILDDILSPSTPQVKPDVQTDHQPNDDYRFLSNAQPTLYQHLALPPAHSMLSSRPLTPSFFHSHYMPPFMACHPPLMQPYATSSVLPPPFMACHSPLMQPYATSSVLPPPFMACHPPLMQPYATSSVLPPPSFLPFTSPQSVAGMVPYINTMHTHLRTKNVPNSATKKAFYEADCPVLRHIYKIGSFKIFIHDSQQMWHICAKQFGYITFDDDHRSANFFLSNFFFYDTSFAADSQKPSWVTVNLWMSAKKLDYFHPPIPDIFRKEFFSKLHNYNPTKYPHDLLDLLAEVKQYARKNLHYFCQKEWKKISVTFMLQALYQKFHHHPQLQLRLLNTGNKIIVYQHKYTNPYSHLTQGSKEDGFWGAHAISGHGYNVLGNLLCLVREYLTNGQTPPPIVIPDTKKL